MAEETINILVTRPAPMTMPPVFEWLKNESTGRTYKGKRLFRRHILKPGPNKGVSAAHWERVKHSFKKHLKAGIVVAGIDESRVPQNLDPGQLITVQTVEKALIAIAECTDLVLLSEWAKNDERAEVRQAIMSRAQQLQSQESGLLNQE